MRFLVVLKSGQPIVLDKMYPFTDTLTGDLATGGKVYIPRENVEYVEEYSDNQIEQFRFKFSQAQSDYDKRQAVSQFANR